MSPRGHEFPERDTTRCVGLALLAAALVAIGCASSVAQRDSTSPATPPSPNRALIMAINTEVDNLSPKASGPTNPDRTTRLFNADLTVVDAQLQVRPYLAEALPRLNTDSWRVLPDGRMETTWTLRPGLTWHDGEPLTSDDFVFALQLYKVPELAAFFSPKPQDLIDRMSAVDARTIRISWRVPYLHQGDGLTPLPRHVLAEPVAAFEQDPAGQRDAFAALRFWTMEYVGAGPYRLTGWEPAAHLTGEAFDAHALGKPKIGRIELRFINNNNTVLANVMAGDVDMALAQAIRFEQAMTLREQAGYNDTEKKGVLLFSPQSTVTVAYQFRPEYQQTPGLLDLRVRQAIAHATDREAINDRLFEGQSPVPVSFVYPEYSYYPDVLAATAKYPYDPKRTEQLMSEAGYARDRDGSWTGPAGQRFQPPIYNNGDAQHQITTAILLDTWRRAGIDAQNFVMPQGFILDLEAVSTYPGSILETVGTSAFADRYTTSQIASPSNRWRGSNRGGWSSPDFDQAWGRFNSTLDVAEQTRAAVQLMQIHSEQLPSYPLAFNLQVVAHVAALKGPQKEVRSWNIHEWEWQ